MLFCAPLYGRPVSDRNRAIRRVRARKLRQRRWRCVTGAADRRRRDRCLCPCQLCAGGLCAAHGKAQLLICSGAASRRDCLMGVQLGFMGFNSVARSSGPVYRAAAAVRGLAGSSGRLSPCFPDDEAPRCDCRGPALRAGRSRVHRPRRFRRSHAWTSRAGRCCRLFSPAKCGPGRPLPC